MKIFIILFLILLLLACTDSDVSKNIILINNDKSHIYFSDERVNKVVIPQQVVNVKSEGDYLFVLRMVSESVDCIDSEGDATIMTHYSGVEEYWVIYNDDKVEGPFDKISFENKVKSLGLGKIELDIPKDYKPNTSNFKIIISKCKKHISLN